MSTRWSKVGDIFDAARRLPERERAAFVAASCAGDGALEAEVRSLLASHEAAEGFLEPEPHEPPVIPGLPVAGDRVGSWKVVRPLAEGGMGVVFLVEREDGEFRQRGALKIIRQGLATEEMVRRFQRERQILASLDHPNMARLLDGGTTGEGLPWLVMEYVDGSPLYDWCSTRTPALNERLRLFLALCGSVAAAHRHLVLHRDIKPGNVLVTSDGTPRLLDFGVAKIFSTDGIAPEPEATTLHAPLTPEYASPEQLRGLEVSTTSDVYSLGVLLYELATGARPYPTRAEGPAQLWRSVLEADPMRPSTAAGTRAATARARETATRSLPTPPSGTPGGLSRALAGDLDNIILKALSKEPARRYGTVDDLAADLRRYLDGRPVEARPSTWSYRARKFARRNRVPVLLGSVALLAIAAGLVVSLRSAAEARRAREAAERRLRDVTAMANTVLWDVNEELATMPGTTPMRERIVDEATKYLDGIATEGVRDTALIRTLADAYDKLGTVQGYAWSANLGRAEEGYRALRKAYELRARLVAADSTQEERLLDLAVSATKLGNLDREHGRTEEALRMSHESVGLMARLRREHPDVRRYRINVPRLLHNDGLALLEAGRVDSGLAQIRRGITAFEELAAWEPADPGHRAAVAQALTGYAEALMQAPGTTDSALAALGRARDILQTLAERDSGDAALRRRIGAVHYDTGRILLLRRKDAAGALREAIASAEITARAVRDDPGNDDANVSHLIARTFVGYARAAGGRWNEAERELTPLIEELRRRAAGDTTDTRFVQELVEASYAMGIVSLGRAERATGPRAETERRRAAAWLSAAKRGAVSLAARGSAWTLAREQTEGIDAALARASVTASPPRVGESLIAPSRP